MSLSYFLKITRLNLGLSQRDLAEKTGIAATLLSRYETGKLNPRADTLKKISVKTGVPLAHFLQAQEGLNPLSEVNEPSDCSKAGLLPILEHAQQLILNQDQYQVDFDSMRHIAFPFDDFFCGVNKQKLVGYFIDDLSMQKQFKYGSLILIDTGNRALISGRFVCITLAGRLVIKYVVNHTALATTFMSTDADSLMPPVSLDALQFDVVGTVVWKSELMI